MNIILLEKDDFIDVSRVSITGHRSEHISAVLRAEPGQTLKIGMINGNIGQGIFIAGDSQHIELEVGDFTIAPPAPLPITLIVAMQRPKTMKKIIQSATAMGVKRFIIIETWKVEKSYWSSPLLQPREFEEQFRLGLAQGGDTVVPTIIIKKRFKPFVEDELPGIVNGTLGLVAHPTATELCPYNVNGQVTLAIGPEGGFTAYEVDKMSAAGMLAVNIGPRPLRSEFAVTAILARLS
ncbi:MAG: 16S rRNA (uracil(1498)-N(3))-methyltransferase [Victivallaceae bacterium]|nr:16S rRNA (uracil(1498)-N(3))-methyltransferase [Victivallaceae bacterium]